MSLLDQIVTEALRNQVALTALRPVVEKELLHHDILREMNEVGLLRKLTFFGGTCLRLCYGSARLSEDLDFSGGANFSAADLSGLPQLLTDKLYAKYQLAVTVSEPTKEDGNVDTWKVRIVTRPDRPDLPAQRIHIDICSIPSHQRQPMMLRNPYGVDMGTSGLILQAETLEEILADKVIAFALRRGKIKNRDLWDLVWLRQQNVELSTPLLLTKVADRNLTAAEFQSHLGNRLSALTSDPALQPSFAAEMTRFLPPSAGGNIVTQADYWEFLKHQISQVCAIAANGSTSRSS